MSIQKRTKAIAPFIIGGTILLGSTLVFSNLSYSYANSKSIVIEIGAALIILCGFLVIPWSTFKNIFRSKIVIGCGAFLIVSLIATLMSTDRTLSWLSHLERGTGMFYVLTAALGAFFATLVAYETGTFRKAILYPIIIASGIIGLSTILGYTGLNIVHGYLLGQGSGGGGLTGNSSYAGSFLMMGIFIIGYLFFTATSKKEKIFLTLASILTIVNPVFLRYGIFRDGFHGFIAAIGDARGAAISLLVGLLFAMGIYLAYAHRNIWRWFGKLLAALMLTLTIGTVILLVIPNSPVNQFFVSNTSGARFIYWNMALESAKAHPLIGTGPETFRYVHDYYFNPDLMRKSFLRELYADKPHNAYLEILVTTGILGVLAYAVLLVALIWSLASLGRKKEHRALVASISGFLLAYLLNNLILFDIAVSYFVFFIVIFWLAVEERKGKALMVNNAPVAASTTDFFGRLILGLAVLAIILAIVIPEIRKLRLVLTEMYAPLEARIGLYQKSEAASPFGSGLSFAQRADVYSQNYLSHIDEILKSSQNSQTTVLADIDSIMSEERDMLEKYPPNTQGLGALAQLASAKIVLEDKADPEAISEMISAGEQILALSPRNPRGYWMIGQAYAYEGKDKEALDAFEKAIAIDPHVPESYETLLHFAQIIGNKELYNKTLEAYNANVIPADR